MSHASSHPARGHYNWFSPLLSGLVAAVGVLGGLVPTLSPNAPMLDFSRAAYAQSISQNEMRNYARSVLAIEPIRQSAFQEIRRILRTDNVPSIVCHQQSSLQNLPSNVRQIATSYCSRAIEIVERNDLTINRFNTITLNLQSNPSLEERIRQEMIRIQNAQER